VATLKTRMAPTRPYEIVYIFDSALEDSVIAEKLVKHHALLELTDEATIEHWGRRQLAYKIGRHEAGYYVIANVMAAPSTLPEFERALKLDEGVVRYMVSLIERVLGAPKLSEEELAARAAAADDDDDEDDE
jgi:small subunit ribosomal protein S6